MDIWSDFNSDGAVQLEALGALGAEFPEPLFNNQHKLRHPLGIYNVSLVRIGERWEEALSQLDAALASQQYKEPKGDWGRELLAAHEAFLYALAEHFDDCSSILLCFFGSGNDFAKNKHVKGFKSAIESYRKYVAKIVNKIKHENSRLRSIIFYSPLNHEYAFPGYFVEGIVGSGELGPDVDVHGTTASAFSFAREMRFHLVNLFWISHKLAATVRAIAKSVDGPQQSNLQIGSLAKSISALSPIYFPDEIRKPNPSVRISSSKLHLTISPDGPKPKSFQTLKNVGRLTVSASYMGDGVTRSFRIPYPQM